MLALVLAGYFIVIGASNAAHNAKLAREQRAVEREVTEIRASIDQLGAARAYVRSDAFIESVARNELNLVRPGEVLVKVLPLHRDDSDTEPQGTAATPWWERLLGQ